jgi:hypothetical protein
VRHLKAFLQNAPETPDAGEHVAHARATLAQLTGEALDAPEAPVEGERGY